MPVNGRRGVTLVEVVVALLLGAVIAAPALSLWRTHRRAAADASPEARARLAAWEALEVVTALARAAEALRVAGDTALLLRSVVREGIACADGRLFRPLDDAIASDGVRSSGDEWWRGAEDPGIGEWIWRRMADTLGTTAGCVLAMPTTLIRVSRVAVVTSYYAGDGQWMIGWRSCSPVVCGAVQPVAGPVRSRGNGGFRLSQEAGGVVVTLRVPGVEDTLRRRVAWP